MMQCIYVGVCQLRHRHHNSVAVCNVLHSLRACVVSHIILYLPFHTRMFAFMPCDVMPLGHASRYVLSLFHIGMLACMWRAVPTHYVFSYILVLLRP
jgi:hypothetical protein